MYMLDSGLVTYGFMLTLMHTLAWMAHALFMHSGLQITKCWHFEHLVVEGLPHHSHCDLFFLA